MYGRKDITYIRLICAGRLREKYYIDAFEEYSKRLGAFIKFECVEISEQKTGDTPSAGEIAKALEKETRDILKQIPEGAFTVALCIEGRKLSSEKLAEQISALEGSGRSKICFIIGSSFGLSDTVKNRADLKLSMSDMTFPHHLARVMLSEQIYRAYMINSGSRYHK